MKRVIKSVKILPLILVVILFYSCQDKIKDTYKVNTPIYLGYEDLRSSLKISNGEDIKKPGKIYFKGTYIFINEYQEGIHVVDNADPENPKNIKFIEIPGNVDMAIKGNMLYVDSYVDLVTLNISNIEDIEEVDRDTNVFPYVLPAEYPDGNVEQIDQSKGVVIDYEFVEKTEDVELNNQYYSRYYKYESNTMSELDYMVSADVSGGSEFGKGGSMARFTLYDNYLYIIDNSKLKLFNVSESSNPAYSSEIFIQFGIETLFPYEENLFIGSQRGMFIYSLSNPEVPTKISTFSHVTACDPVVVEGDYAYVTLRGGNLCGAVESQLDVIDISDIENPKFLKSYPMEEPYGLGIDDNTLFVCDGDAGLKIYDATDPLKISDNVLVEYPDINAFDVIPLGEILLMIGEDGLYQYNYAVLDSIEQISHLPIYRE